MNVFSFLNKELNKRNRKKIDMIAVQAALDQIQDKYYDMKLIVELAYTKHLYIDKYNDTTNAEKRDKYILLHLKAKDKLALELDRYAEKNNLMKV